MIRVFGSPSLDDDYLTEEDTEDDAAEPGLKRQRKREVGDPTAKRVRRTK
jgi:hypothetical protein